MCSLIGAKEIKFPEKENNFKVIYPRHF